MFSPVGRGNFVVDVPRLRHQNKASATVAASAMPHKNPKPNPFRNSVIVGPPRPLRG